MTTTTTATTTTTTTTFGERRNDHFRYLDANARLVVGTVWCPGPVSRSVWVLPEGATRSAEVVAVRHPTARRPRYHLDGRRAWPEGFNGWWQDWRVEPGGQWYREDVRRETTIETSVSPKDWRDALAADPTIGEQHTLEASA